MDFDGLRINSDETAATQDSVSSFVIPTSEYIDSLRKTMEAFGAGMKAISAAVIATPEYIASLRQAMDAFNADMKAISAATIPAISTSFNVLAQTLASIRDFLDRGQFIHGHIEALKELTLDGEQETIILSSIDRARPYMTPAQAEAVEEIAPTIKKRLSLSDAITLLGILVTILTTLLSFAPDPQLDEIIEQQEILIDQNDALTGAISELTKSVVLLKEEIEILTEENDGLCEENDGFSEPDKQNAQPEQDQVSGEIADAVNQ